MTPSLCRAARALINWPQPQLARAAGLGLSTIVDFEKERRVISTEAQFAIRSAFTSAGVEFINDERGEGVVKLRLPQAATEAEIQASADEVRHQAADAVDEALNGTDATAQQRADRRGALTDEPAVVGRARGKGRGKRP